MTPEPREYLAYGRRGRRIAQERAPVEKGPGDISSPGPEARSRGAYFFSCFWSQSFPSTNRETMKETT